MPVTTSQQITRYFQQFSQAEITFTREVVQTVMLNTKQVFLKCLGAQWPCIVYAASMTSARIIANLNGGLNDCIRNANGAVQLRFSFNDSDKPDPITFFVPAKVAGITPYGPNNKELFFANLEFTQRPPDDLIHILGQLLEANVNAKRRREERIPLVPAAIKLLSIVVDDCGLTVDGIQRRAIFRDVSFSGCKVVLMGVPKLLVNRAASVRLVFDDPEQTFEIPGSIVRFDPVEGRSDIAAFGIRYEDDKVPMAYKMRINAAMKQARPAPQAKEN